ncbi:hypothetical protein [Corynebacterium meridianum]|uniref:Uncharacterized protein n=1 Tax=Corynebacterium meridianum TaxID=2765363 RepID=A0A934I4W5_9CORY|nr:hypothetical protein [Corynebacterium meridianum]MBI8988434.1 hypothetical protein [Corynebacterium meridianum]
MSEKQRKALAAVRKAQAAMERAEKDAAKAHAEHIEALGEALFAAAYKKRSKWFSYRNKPLLDLLIELGLVEAEEAEDAAEAAPVGDEASAGTGSESVVEEATEDVPTGTPASGESGWMTEPSRGF